MRLVLLGNPRLKRSWKNCVAHAARQLDWDVTVLQDDAVTIGRVIAECAGADLLLWARSNSLLDRRFDRIDEAAGAPTPSGL